MLRLKDILFALISAIVLLHTVFVHQHEHTGDGNVCQLHQPKANLTLFDSLAFTLAIDHGAGHLEHFVSLQDDFLPAAPVQAPEPATGWLAKYRPPTTATAFSSPAGIRPPKRGPPTRA